MGDEYNQSLRARLRSTLKSLGATSVISKYGVAGSQEIETLTCNIDGHLLTIEAETYVGLSITGFSAAVDGVVAALTADAQKRHL